MTALIAQNTITMSSREIAALCEKRHTHVLRDIEKMLQDIDEPKFGLVDFASTYTDPKGEQRKEYRLPKDLTFTLITGYRADLRYKVVKRLEELETAPLALPDFSDPIAAARAWADAQESALKAQSEVKRLEPKAAAYDRFLSCEGMVGLRDAMRSIGARPQKGIDELKVNVLFYKGKTLTPRARYVQLGYFVVRQREVDGEVRKQTMVTPKGLDWLARTLSDAVFLKGAA